MLKPRKKITKKQLKEDKLVTFYFQAQEWLEVHGKTLAIVAAAVVLAIAGYAYYAYAQQNAEKKAGVDLARATRTLDAMDYQNAISQLSSVVDSYGSTTSGRMARLYLAQAFFQTKEHQKAKSNYKKFVSTFSGDEYLLAAAQSGYAACLEEEKKYAEAAKAYLDGVDSYDSVLGPGLLINAGRCFTLAGDEQNAKKAYQRVVDQFPKAAEKDDALMLLSMLGG